ncbi:hypothetical protein [Burkholderia plantarii]|uniref:hypothetical protein n=1 Tax=Burkholderia plantarii TaxID=41899 RepID=UPI00114CB596|nr:hypothetical protein [Burkholderia plantarii]
MIGMRRRENRRAGPPRRPNRESPRAAAFVQTTAFVRLVASLHFVIDGHHAISPTIAADRPPSIGTRLRRRFDVSGIIRTASKNVLESISSHEFHLIVELSSRWENACRRPGLPARHAPRRHAFMILSPSNHA